MMAQWGALLRDRNVEYQWDMNGMFVVIPSILTNHGKPGWNQLSKEIPRKNTGNQWDLIIEDYIDYMGDFFSQELL